MFIETDPFKRDEFDPTDVLPPDEADLQFVREKVDRLVNGPSSIDTVSALHSGKFHDLNFSVQSSNSFSESSLPAERLRATLDLGLPDTRIDLDSSQAKGHTVSLAGEVLTSDGCAALVSHAMFAFIRGSLEAEINPKKMENPAFKDALTSLYFNARNIIGSCYIRERSYERTSVSSEEFFSNVPKAIMEAIQQTGRGEFVTTAERDINYACDSILTIKREDSFVHIDRTQQKLPTVHTVKYTKQDQVWDPLATIPVRKSHQIIFATVEDVPRYIKKTRPYGDVRFKPGFDRPPFNSGLQKVKELKKKYKEAEERRALKGDFRSFKDLLNNL